MQELPSLNGNWVDLLIILVVFFYLLSGWRRGFVGGILDLAGFVFSFLLAFKFYSFFGDLLISNFSLPRGIAYAVGFLFTGLLGETIFSFLMSVLYKTIYTLIVGNLEDKSLTSVFSKIDRFFGFIPALGEAIIILAFFLTLFIALPVRGSLKKEIFSSRIGGPLVLRAQVIERRVNEIFGQAVNETLTFLTVKPTSSEKVDLHFTTTDVKVDTSAEVLMFNLVNSEREKVGQKKLVLSKELSILAENYGKEMFVKGYFSHYDPSGLSPFDRMRDAGIGFSAAGENLAFAQNVYIAHSGLMNSPGHRANILSPDYGKVGVGVIDGGVYGEMFVQEFTN